MTKRLVDLDDELLSAAQHAAGEDTIKGTITRALEELVTRSGVREAELRDRWTALGDSLADLEDPEVMREAWS
jgi:Arc/MetJ family transcription regulator